MSAVIAVPDLMAEAATDLSAIGSTLDAAHMTAAAPTVAVLPAAADEVSVGIAHLFSGYGQEYQALAGQAAAFHSQFVQHLTTSAASYASAEDAIAALLQGLRTNGRYFFNDLEILEFNAVNAAALPTVVIVSAALFPAMGPLAILVGVASLFPLSLVNEELVSVTETIAQTITGLSLPSEIAGDIYYPGWLAYVLAPT